MEETKREEEGHIQHFKARLEHIKAFHNKDDKEHISKFHSMRVDRVMVDYMLREGLYDTAIQLAEEANITVSAPTYRKSNNVKDLVDIDIFISSKKVIEGLNNHDCSEALQWCADNRSKLKKMKVGVCIIICSNCILEQFRILLTDSRVHRACPCSKAPTSNCIFTQTPCTCCCN